MNRITPGQGVIHRLAPTTMPTSAKVFLLSIPSCLVMGANDSNPTPVFWCILYTEFKIP